MLCGSHPAAGTLSFISNFQLTLLISKLHSFDEQPPCRESPHRFSPPRLLSYQAPNWDITINCLKAGGVNNPECRGRIYQLTTNTEIFSLLDLWLYLDPAPSSSEASWVFQMISTSRFIKKKKKKILSPFLKKSGLILRFLLFTTVGIMCRTPPISNRARAEKYKITKPKMGTFYPDLFLSLRTPEAGPARVFLDQGDLWTICDVASQTWFKAQSQHESF